VVDVFLLELLSGFRSQQLELGSQGKTAPLAEIASLTTPTSYTQGIVAIIATFA
jgi:hypothetical protein